MNDREPRTPANPQPRVEKGIEPNVYVPPPPPPTNLPGVSKISEEK